MCVIATAICQLSDTSNNHVESGLSTIEWAISPPLGCLSGTDQTPSAWQNQPGLGVEGAGIVRKGFAPPGGGEAWMPTQLEHRGRMGEDAPHFMGWMIKLGHKSSSHQLLLGQGPPTQVRILIQQVYSKS
jgi:hypothetical protein